MKLNSQTKKMVSTVVTIMMMVPVFLFAQTGGQSSEPELNKYNNTINFPKAPKIEYSNLGNRQVLSAPEMRFVADDDIVIEFEITIGPEGRVFYVKPSGCAPQFNEYRKGGINYLYATRFSPRQDVKEDQHVKAVFTFPGVQFSSQKD